jgi:hypothetical protein
MEGFVAGYQMHLTLSASLLHVLGLQTLFSDWRQDTQILGFFQHFSAQDSQNSTFVQCLS